MRWWIEGVENVYYFRLKNETSNCLLTLVTSSVTSKKMAIANSCLTTCPIEQPYVFFSTVFICGLFINHRNLNTMDRRDSAFFSANRLYPAAMTNSPLPKPVKVLLILLIVGCAILMLMGIIHGLNPNLIPFLKEKDANGK